MNPVATEEQHEHERAAVELFAHPTVRAAYGRVRDRWLEKADPSPVQRSCFDWAFEEVMFSAAIWSSNQDPLRPKVVTITRLAHPLGAVPIPGSRWGIDNPDSVYRVIPISGAEEYRIHGRVAERRLTENYFTLWDPNMNTIDVLSGHDLVLNDDRTFTVTVDAQPADGRRNHIQSSPEAREFYIRDVLLDWANDTPNELTIERLGDSPSTAPLTVDEQAELTTEYMLKFADFSAMLSKNVLKGPANNFGLAWSADTGGALRNQVYQLGHFNLADDEAFVINVSDGGAAYFVVPISNIWGTTLDLANRTSTLNKAQSVANADGTYTYVLAREDPGVHNWLDPCDLPEGIITLRMAEFPGGRPNDDLAAHGELVKLADLADHLPESTTWVTPADRALQRADRAAAYRRRLPELP